jgi:hypothetical protein
MTPDATCLRCRQVISREDTVERQGDRVVHLDCRLPRRLSREERALLYQYCWDHTVGECVSCARSFRPDELHLGLFGDTDVCPQCRKDLTDNVRAHLYGCAMLPAEVRRRAQETRAAAQELVTQSGQPRDKADMRMREVEVSVAALRDAMKQSAFETVRHTIRLKLCDGSLPHDGIPATIPGRPGDDSACGACDHIVTSRDLMIVVPRHAAPLSAPHEATSIAFHADCFRLWNEERRTFKPNF